MPRCCAPGPQPSGHASTGLQSSCLTRPSGGGGGMAAWARPPKKIRKAVPQGKNGIYRRGPNLEGDFRDTNVFCGLSAPPPMH